MHFYAQIDKTRRCVSVTHAAGPINSASLIELASYDTQLLGHVHNAATGEWQASQPQSEPRRLTPLAFRRRFTRAERGAIEWAAVDRTDQSAQQRQVAAALRADLADQAAAQFIDLDDEDVIYGVQATEALGLIATGRAAEILGGAVQPEERP